MPVRQRVRIKQQGNFFFNRQFAAGVLPGRRLIRGQGKNLPQVLECPDEIRRPRCCGNVVLLHHALSCHDLFFKDCTVCQRHYV